ncbi:MAG: pyridoxamine 5'-phosphate oxidase family protein [Thermomicrobium sp.]|nr:pyridoxamine 5'-phosphate oxidase family protein [Thermomicrobium sp.]MDW8059426.1 pyridoxamine 5'-phosphate oxidase family protein [Thermomicrobium sp.]
MGNRSSRSTIRRHPERAVTDEAAEILARGLVAHVGFCEGEQPFVIPMSYHFDPTVPDRLYLHGARESRLLQVLASGAPVSIAVTLVDGLVYSRTAFNHSMNYRSVVCFGRARIIESEAEQRRIFEAMTERYFPGRRVGVDYQGATPQQLAATLLVEVEIEEWSAKARRGGPRGPYDADPSAPGTAGIVPIGD